MMNLHLKLMAIRLKWLRKENIYNFNLSIDDPRYTDYMQGITEQLALDKASESVAQGGFPAGSVVVKDGEVVGAGVSSGNKLNDPTSHGEVATIREACLKLKTTDLSGTVLYSSLEPCLMCLGAAMWASIPRIVYACAKEKVSEEYYGGHYDEPAINQTFIHPIELVHAEAFEEESLKIIREWEKNLNYGKAL